MSGAEDLAKTLSGLGPSSAVTFRLGQVVGAGTRANTIKITVGGSAVQIDNIAYLASYTSPTANDRIWILDLGGDLLALGKQANA